MRYGTLSTRLALGAALVIALGALSGCSGTVALTVAGVAGDIASRAATGKGLVDEAVSRVSGRDCEMYRVFDGQEVCHDAPAAQKPQRAPAVAMALSKPDTMPVPGVTFDGKDGRGIMWAPVAGGWVPLDPASGGADGGGASARLSSQAGPAHGVVSPPSADAVIYAAAGSDERIGQDK